jgi:hypothetical protein
MSIAHDLAWYAVLAASTVVVSLPCRASAAPRCDAAGTDAAALAQARTAVHRTCSCASTTRGTDWRRCVRGALTPLEADAGLSPACERHVRHIETRSTCGRPGKVVCCRTFANGRTAAMLRRDGHCTAPRTGSACESPSPYVADSCTLDGCEVSPGCGNSVVEAGETCDPPNGMACNAECSACASDAGSTLLGCTSGGTQVAAAATPDTFLVAWTDFEGFVPHAVARRVGAHGAPLDAPPLEVSGTIPDTSVSEGFTSAATADEASFYVAWSASDSGAFTYFAGRRVPTSGPIAAPVELLLSHLSVGSCGTAVGGPLGLAPTLDSTSVHFTYRVIFYCGGGVLAEILVGVGPTFAFPPPGNISTGMAPLARGAGDVAGIWWNILVPSIPPPPDPIPTLKASFIAPGSPAIITLSSGSSPVSPALAAVGDVFVAFFTTGSEIRALRFTRAAGPLDPDGGSLVASANGTVGTVAAGGDGTQAIAAWRESSGPGTSAIRAVHLAPDGTVLDPTPIDVATSHEDAAVSVAANSAGALVAFTLAEALGTSVRGVLLGP